MKLGPTKWESFIDWLDEIIHARPDWWWAVRNFINNIPLFLGLAWRYRRWDSHYSIVVFTRLLEENARCCRRGHNVAAEKVYRRAMTAAGMLDRAYNYGFTDDKAYMYLARKYPWNFENRQISRPYESGSLPDKLSTFALKRAEKTEKQMKLEAWMYVNKYSSHFWS